MPFKLDKLGQWSEEFEFKVDVERAKAYAEATNDTIAEHTSGELAPPNFAVVPLFETPAMAAAGAGVVELTQQEMFNVLHGEQDLVIHRPITPGMVLRVKGTCIGVHGKSSGTTVVNRIETSDQDGNPVNTQYMTAFYRGISTEASGGEEAPDHTLPEGILEREPTATVTQRFDEDQTFRYSKASGDMMPMHLDEDLAKSVGLPGIIIHGLCTMAFVSHAIVNEVGGGDPRRLKRLALRFSRVALPGQEITTKIWETGASDGKTVYAFVTENPAGEPVLTNGLAEIG